MRCPHRLPIAAVSCLATLALATAAAPDTPPSKQVPPIEEQVRALREAGESVDVAGLFVRPPEVAPDRNAAGVLVRAAEKLHGDGKQIWSEPLTRKSIRDYQGPLTPAAADEVREAVRAQGPTLEMLDRAAGLTECDWGPLPEGPLVLHKGESPFRVYVGELAKLCFLDGVLAVRDGDAPRAMRRAAALRVIADAAARHPDATISSYWRHAAGLRADLLARVATVEDFDPEKLGGALAMRELVRRGLDSANNREAFLRELRAERVALIDAATRVEAGTLDPHKLGGSAYRVADYTTMRIGVPMWPAALALLTGAIDVAVKPELSRADGAAALQQFFRSHAERGFMPQRVTFLLGPWYDQSYESVVQLRTAETLAAVALAVRLYRVDHAGAFPPSLDALVPAYLPAVPNDPLAKPAAPVRYKREGDAPMVWSAGDNGVDDGGREPVEAESLRERNAHADRIVHLKPRR